MSNTRDGGPAFPTSETRCGPYTYKPPRPGLTKRELFAAMAMQGVLSNEGLVQAVGGKVVVRLYVGEDESVEVFARKRADALLAELEKNDE